MKTRKLLSLLTALALCLSMLGAGALAEEPKDLLPALTGTYDELFTVICAPEYDQIWLDSCTTYIGEGGAKEAAAMLKAACVGTIYGQEAIDAYAAAPETAVFDCFFIHGVKQFTFDGDRISGVDEAGNVVFDHAYQYVETFDGMIPLHIYKADDANAADFTYFAIAADTPATTFHIEFRYGSNLNDLKEYYEGEYAYWLAAGILADRDDEMVQKVIDLFCEENLQAEEEQAS